MVIKTDKIMETTTVAIMEITKVLKYQSIFKGSQNGNDHGSNVGNFLGNNNGF